MLEDIEKGIIKVEALKKPIDVYCGNIPYKLSNGWIMEIFSDCDEFDYVALFISPEGIEFDFWEDKYLWEYKKLKGYRPDDDVEQNIYGIWHFTRN